MSAAPFLGCRQSREKSPRFPRLASLAGLVLEFSFSQARQPHSTPTLVWLLAAMLRGTLSEEEPTIVLFLYSEFHRLDEQLVAFLNRNIVIAGFDLGNLDDDLLRGLFHHRGLEIVLFVGKKNG